MPTTEESVQFSLKELLELEDERLAEQTRDHEAREARAAHETAARQAQEKAQKSRLDEEKRKSERDEVAKREAMQRAVVEQARLVVEVKARGEERERERRHEIELEQLRRVPQGTPVHLQAGAALLGGVVMLGVMLGVHFGIVRPTADKNLAAVTQEASEAKARAFDLAKTNEEQRRTNVALKNDLDRLQASLAAAHETPPVKTATARPNVVAPKSPPPPPQKETPCANKWDPMCGTIGP